MLPAEKTELFEGVTIPVGSVDAQGGYVHCRKRREILGKALDIDIPAEVVHHKDLMTDGLKPSTNGYKRAEKILVQVRQAQARGEDPAPLWAKWMPSTAKPKR